MLRELGGRIAFLVLLYTLGMLFTVFFLLLRLTGRLRVVGRENIRNHKRGLVVFANHPSLLEPITVPSALFFPDIFLHPFGITPWTAGDKKNYYDPWYYTPFRFLRLIPIRRNERGERSDSIALRKMLRVIQRGDNLILYPEGTRTGKTSQFYTTPDGKKRLGHFRRGMELLVRQKNVTLLPVWVEGSDIVLPIGSYIPRFWKAPVTIIIGKPFQPDPAILSGDPVLCRQYLEEKLLELTEQT